MSSNSETRFSNRVDDYAKYRPSYPRAVVDFLRDGVGVSAGSVVADIGSGTGIFTSLLLDAGFDVIAIEPNAPMREAAEHALGHRNGFRSVDGSAEHTTLDDATVDLVTAAQAYHWFDPERTRSELARILRPDGFVALLWNDRIEGGSDFAREYQALIDRYNTDLATVDHRRMTRDDTAAIATLFGASGFNIKRFDNWQELDFEGLRGRLVSSSYIPAAGAPRYDEMIGELEQLFARHAAEGRIRLDYDTRLYYGRIGAAH